MNTNLLDILKRIVSERGEDILSDSEKIKPLFSDLAKDEPKSERIAFGRCIQIGAYRELKNTASPDERRRKKALLAAELYSKAGIDKPEGTAALDLLEAVIFPPTAPAPQPANPYAQPGASSGAGTLKEKPISNRTVNFGIAGALGGLIGSIIGGAAARGTIGIINWVLWIAPIAIAISAGLLIAQHIYLKKKPAPNPLVKALLIGVLMGIGAGIIAGITIRIIPGAVISRLIAWGVTGFGIGLVATLFISNYPKKRAMLAGLMGGGIAYVVVMIISPLIGGFAGVVAGDIALGLFTGLSVSIIEEALREAWITVIWGPKETRSLALGEKPIIFGSSPEADIHLSGDAPVRASVQIENGQVVMHDKVTNQRQVLKNETRIDFGKLSFVMNTKK